LLPNRLVCVSFSAKLGAVLAVVLVEERLEAELRLVIDVRALTE
jgi:hypothetical protein